MGHISSTRGHNHQLVIKQRLQKECKGHLRPVAPRSRNPVPNIPWSLALHSNTVSAPHLLLRVLVGTILDQSLDNLRVPIYGSPHQGSPALLQDKHTSRGCSLALSGKAGVRSF
jgi:hypothetical protein